MVTLIATENSGEVLEEGIYRLRFVKTEPRQGTKQVELEDGTFKTEESTYLRWEFKVVEEGFEDAYPIRANSSTAFGPQAKARGWAEAILGRQLLRDEPCDLDVDLADKECLATIKVVQKGDKQYNEIVSLAPIRKPKPKGAASVVDPKAPALVEPDDIEF